MLTDRQKLILSAVINSYIESAEPVGSRAISKRQEIGYSSATIRNDMADLEEMGFLEQPHTSAGRVPSNKGYRYYVDHLINPGNINLSKEIFTNISYMFTEHFNEFERILEQTSTILSQITNYTSIVLGPEIYKTRLKQIQIVPLSDQNVVVILVTNTGKVQHKTITVPNEISVDSVERMVYFLNQQLTGVPLYQLKSKILKELHQEFQKNVREYEQMMQLIDQAILHDIDNHTDHKIYVGGTTNILNQPEFNDINTIKDLLMMFEKTEDVRELMKSDHKGIEVKIGSENTVVAASNSSIITASYEVDGVLLGKIGIFGPTRMDYSRMIRILDFLAYDFSHFIMRLYK
ncbi:heat-inducible transcriptional repressor HrcA [Tepidibacillus marianensis]|uniref:heat-inducible transcriptional repressor HrcA n=1 Tax=Tepidibacillus marianensis TaxID=3131995 RepID=UPI0030CF9DF0